MRFWTSELERWRRKRGIVSFWEAERRVRLMSGRNPMSSIRSTSSRTRRGVDAMERCFLAMRSRSLPGVAMSISMGAIVNLFDLRFRLHTTNDTFTMNGYMF